MTDADPFFPAWASEFERDLDALARIIRDQPAMSLIEYQVLSNWHDDGVAPRALGRRYATWAGAHAELERQRETEPAAVICTMYTRFDFSKPGARENFIERAREAVREARGTLQ